MLESLVNFDTKSLVGVLVWGNIATGIIVFLYQTFDKHKTDYNIRNMAIIRLLYAVGFLLMFLRGSIHDVASVNICNTLLFLCNYLESRLMLELAGIADKKINNVLSAILVIDVLIFNLMEFYYKDASLRVGMASVIMFSILLLPAIKLMTSKVVSDFKRGVSIFYLFLLLALIPRGIEAFIDKSIHIYTNDYIQTLLFLSLILLMISNTIIYLLFIKEQTDTLVKKMATYDNLTEVLNRHSFLERGKQAFESHRASQTGLTVLFFDIDHFKNVNDEYGHRFGDEVLARFAGSLKMSIRPNDLCCRYGGEEFVVILMNVTESIGNMVANRIMGDIQKCSFESQPDFRITTSIGSMSGVPKEGEALEDYINKADKALYQAKRTGRNKLVVYSEKNGE